MGIRVHRRESKARARASAKFTYHLLPRRFVANHSLDLPILHPSHNANTVSEPNGARYSRARQINRLHRTANYFPEVPEGNGTRGGRGSEASFVGGEEDEGVDRAGVGAEEGLRALNGKGFAPHIPNQNEAVFRPTDDQIWIGWVELANRRAGPARCVRRLRPFGQGEVPNFQYVVATGVGGGGGGGGGREDELLVERGMGDIYYC